MKQISNSLNKFIHQTRKRRNISQRKYFRKTKETFFSFLYSKNRYFETKRERNGNFFFLASLTNNNEWKMNEYSKAIELIEMYTSFFFVSEPYFENLIIIISMISIGSNRRIDCIFWNNRYMSFTFPKFGFFRKNKNKKN